MCACRKTNNRPRPVTNGVVRRVSSNPPPAIVPASTQVNMVPSTDGLNAAQRRVEQLRREAIRRSLNR